MLSLSITRVRDEGKRSITSQRRGRSPWGWGAESSVRTRGRMCVLEERLLTATDGAFALVLVALIRGNFVRLGSINQLAASFREQK